MIDLGFDIEAVDFSRFKSGDRDTYIALSLKMQAILLEREGISNIPLPDLKSSFRDRRNLSEQLIADILPSFDDRVITQFTSETIEEGWYVPSEYFDIQQLSGIFACYGYFMSRDELEDSLGEYDVDEDEPSADDIMRTYDNITRNNSPYLMEYLDYIASRSFGGMITGADLYPIWKYCLIAFGEMGGSRLTQSYIIKGLTLDDAELEKEIIAISKPLSMFWTDPVIVDTSAGLLLSFVVYDDGNDSYYDVAQSNERPFWRLALKRIEETMLKRMGEGA